MQYLKITFSRSCYRDLGASALIWMCLSFPEAGVGSLHALRSRPRSVPRVGPATRHGQLLWGSDRWDSHVTKMEAGVMVVQENKKEDCVMSELNIEIYSLQRSLADTKNKYYFSCLRKHRNRTVPSFYWWYFCTKMCLIVLLTLCPFEYKKHFELLHPLEYWQKYCGRC